MRELYFGPPHSKYRMPYLPALDGLRAIALLIVMLFHAKAPFANGGYLGVDMFFVLSGFLITALLQEEITKSGTISLGRFYLHRLARLMPPLLLLVAIYLTFAPILWPKYEGHAPDATLAALYLSDYSVAFWGSPKYLRHTWSLSVEEHLYLMWPLALLALRPLAPNRLLAVLIGLYVVATAWRIYCATEQPWAWVYYRFDTRVSGTVLGSALAVAWRLGSFQPQRARFSWAPLAMIITVVGLARWRSSLSLQVGTMAVELLTAWMIVLVLSSTERIKWLERPALVYLGKISYGAYLFHYPIALYLRPHTEWLLTMLVGGGVSLLIAAASYHSIEAWMRRIRKSRSSRYVD
ncbi:MAG TPA: acyltransferase, partial [Pseudomonas sp.]|nr:acyltransferase [Pseudomonas sp.]